VAPESNSVVAGMPLELVGILGLGSVLWYGVFGMTPYMVLGYLGRGSPNIPPSFPGKEENAQLGWQLRICCRPLMPNCRMYRHLLDAWCCAVVRD
jgi:hypothetical protein